MNDLQLRCLKESQTLADVDVHLRIAAGADRERALLLGVESVLLGEVRLDGVRLLERGIDELHLGIALTEVVLHDGIVRAAEDEVFDFFAGEDVVDLRGDLEIDVVLVKVAAVHEGGEQGRALADDMAVGIAVVNELSVLARRDCKFGGDQADRIELFADDVLGGLFHDADDAVVEAGAEPVCHRGDGVAGDGGALDAVTAEKLQHMFAQFEDLVGRLVAVGAVGAVAEVDDILTGQDALQLAHDRQSADAGVHHADGIGSSKHRIVPPEKICDYCTTARQKCKGTFSQKNSRNPLLFPTQHIKIVFGEIRTLKQRSLTDHIAAFVLQQRIGVIDI